MPLKLGGDRVTVNYDTPNCVQHLGTPAGEDCMQLPPDDAEECLLWFARLMYQGSAEDRQGFHQRQGHVQVRDLQ